MSSGPSFGERAEYGESDVCYRHPGRQSFTLCQRCGRTICAECQIESPVGVLCRDCVKQTSGGPKGVARVGRSARVAGRRFAALDYPVTMSIIAINVVVFALQLLSNYFGSNGVTGALWYVPTYSLADGVHQVAPGTLPGYPEGALLSAEFQPWRMLTVMFTHSVGFLPHILFNMLALYMFGRNLEQIIGKWRFLALYVFAGIGGSLGVMLWGYADTSTIFTPTVGASGAIFGVMAATVVAFPVDERERHVTHRAARHQLWYRIHAGGQHLLAGAPRGHDCGRAHHVDRRADPRSATQDAADRFDVRRRGSAHCTVLRIPRGVAAVTRAGTAKRRHNAG